MGTTEYTSMSPALNELIAAIHEVQTIEREPDVVALKVAAALRTSLQQPNLLQPEQREPDPNCYRQHVLYVAPDGSFSVVGLVWLPGQATPIHDHISWCVVGVYEGVEQEVLYDVVEAGEQSYLVPRRTGQNLPGAVEALTPPGDIHHVFNPGPGLALSVHVYGADIGKLGSSIRRRYSYPVREFDAVGTLGTPVFHAAVSCE